MRPPCPQTPPLTSTLTLATTFRCHLRLSRVISPFAQVIKGSIRRQILELCCTADTSTTNECYIFLVGWMEWSPWSPCTVSCGTGGSRQRSRAFWHSGIPGKYNLCYMDDNRELVEGYSEQTEVCSTQTITGWPTCPIPARIGGSWESWSSCSQPCYNEGSQIPLMTRRRECIEATLSTNTSFNTNIVTCSDLQLSQTEPCPLCRGEVSFSAYSVT